MSYPPEVRNQIYGCLFEEVCLTELTHGYPSARHTRQDERMGTRSRIVPKLELVSLSLSSTDRDASLGTGILRTCHQMYHEALPFLYAKRVFRYSFTDTTETPFSIQSYTRLFPEQDYNRVFPEQNYTRVFPEQNLSMIQHFQLLVEERVDENISPDRVAETIDYFCNRSCGLKRLGIEFQFMVDPDFIPEEGYQRWMEAVAEDYSICKSLVALNNLQQIDFTVSDEEPGAGEIFKPLIQYIIHGKGWVCDNEEGAYRFQKENYDLEYHEWTWHLRPDVSRPAVSGDTAALSVLQ